MDFKTRRIRKEPRFKKQNLVKTRLRTKNKRTPKSKYKLHFLTLGGSVVLILILVFSIFQIVQSLDFSSIVFSFGKNLQTDDTGKTNILLVGVGGKGHEGANLTDTIIIASIDHRNNKLIPMISIPRDFYIQEEQSRINSIYFYALQENEQKESMKILQETVTEVTGIPIQYYVKVDFNGFVQIVDSLGGVDLLVENRIYDNKYPKGESIYTEVFSLAAGQQHLDGETALKYARSRKSTSDFDRAKRQQLLLFAIKEKALELNILSDTNKINDLYNSAGASIDTDLSLAEIIELAKIAKDYQKENITPIVINDDPTECGGLIYTPAREYFSGASVLLPAGNNYDYIHSFVDFVLNNIASIKEEHQIQVLNGSKVEGLAYKNMSLISRFCMNIVYYGNASSKDIEESTIYYKPNEEGEAPKILEAITQLIPAKTQVGIPPEYLETERRQNTNIVIELGKDHIQNQSPDPFNSLKYLIAPTPKAIEETVTSAEDSPTTEPEPTVEPEPTIEPKPTTVPEPTL